MSLSALFQLNEIFGGGLHGIPLNDIITIIETGIFFHTMSLQKDTDGHMSNDYVWI
jgi:hypothetical protein